MKDVFVSVTQRQLDGALIEFGPRKISWAGEGVAPDRFLYGSQDGLLFESLAVGPLPNAGVLIVSEAREAINGVAYSKCDGEIYVAASP